MLSGLFSFQGLGRLTTTLLVLGLCCGIAGAQTPSAKDGIWFQVKASIKPAPQQKVGEGKSEPSASLAVKLRITSIAEGSRFHGQPVQTFDFKLADGSGEKLFWQDAACHPRRGLPKVAVIAVDGRLEHGGKTTDVTARPRRLGTKLPDDEISPGSSLVRTVDGEWPAMTFGARTGSSKIDVAVKIYTVDCALNAPTQ